MEHVDSEYANALHQLPFNPYSQHCFQEKGTDNYLWRVNALTDEAADRLIRPLMQQDALKLKRFNTDVRIVKKTSETIDLKSLTDLIYEGAESSKLRISFVSPTAFKSKKDYVIVPSVRLIFQNLLMHYSQVYSGSKEIDEETVSYIEQHTRITAYSLRSQYFDNAASNGMKIPAFGGTMTLHAKGATSMVGLMNMLLKFGEYAGVGIKTSMGMGGMKCL